MYSKFDFYFYFYFFSLFLLCPASFSPGSKVALPYTDTQQDESHPQPTNILLRLQHDYFFAAHGARPLQGSRTPLLSH